MNNPERMLQNMTQQERAEIKNEIEYDNLVSCDCGGKFVPSKSVSEYWGFRETITEHTCDKCGDFFIA